MEELKGKLQGLLAPVQDALRYLGTFVQEEAKRRAKPHPADLGTLANVIAVDFSGGGENMKVEVYVPEDTRQMRGFAGIARTIEEGRAPGNAPPIGAISRWAIAHGYATAPTEVVGQRYGRFSYAHVSPEIWRMVMDIKAHGTKGVYYMKGAADAGSKKAVELMAALKTEIERRWAG
jgi:hypothetical protein